MIDIENEVIDAVINRLRATHDPIYIYGEVPVGEGGFPCVIIQQLDNAIYERTVDCESLENHARVMFQIEVFSNLARGRKGQAKGILHEIDGVLAGVGLGRKRASPIVNLDNPSVYRLVARYDGVVSKDKYVYRR
jgi:hypothetical protein